MWVRKEVPYAGLYAERISSFLPDILSLSIDRYLVHPYPKIIRWSMLIL